ncbi:MAG: rod shape-determining protein, partial [Anaerolineaceae bacterium]|nr:rod shape-determining protein [Anaerolineaceae bacterium]
MALFAKDLGIDLGTNNTRAAEGNQVIIEEPTVAAIITAEQKMVSWGKEAQNMLGRVPDSIEVTRPLRNGV